MGPEKAERTKGLLGEQGHVRAVWRRMGEPALPHRESKRTVRQCKLADKAGASEAALSES